MSLTKEDLTNIKEIVGGTERKLTAKIDERVGSAKDEIINIISREVQDLADINRAVINRAEELDYRLRIVERKLGIKAC